MFARVLNMYVSEYVQDICENNVQIGFLISWAEHSDISHLEQKCAEKNILCFKK